MDFTKWSETTLGPIMFMSCAFKGCKNTCENGHDLTFHRFPGNQVNREQWIGIVQEERQDKSWLPSRSATICSEHFRKEDIAFGLYPKLQKHVVPFYNTVKEAVSDDDDPNIDENIADVKIDSSPEHKVEDVDIGSQGVDNGTQDVDNGTQDIDNGTQDVDNGTQDIDNGTQDVDNGAIYVDDVIVIAPQILQEIGLFQNIYSQDVDSESETENRCTTPARDLIKFESESEDDCKIIEWDERIMPAIPDIKPEKDEEETQSQDVSVKTEPLDQSIEEEATLISQIISHYKPNLTDKIINNPHSTHHTRANQSGKNPEQLVHKSEKLVDNPDKSSQAGPSDKNAFADVSIERIKSDVVIELDDDVKLSELMDETVKKTKEEQVISNFIRRHCCIPCNQFYDKYSELHAHRQTVHRERFKCPVCPKVFHSLKRIKNHLTSHQRKTCPYCDKKLSSASSLRFHIESFHKNTIFNLYKCTYCPKALKTQRQLDLHFKTLHETYDCNYCDMKFTQQLLYKRHFRTHESKTNNFGDETITFVCDICNRKIKYKYCLYMHIKKIHKADQYHRKRQRNLKMNNLRQIKIERDDVCIEAECTVVC